MSDDPSALLDPVSEAVAAVARGELVVVVDDTDRENEGDLIMAASAATAERMAFMIRYTSGIICAPMSAERADLLNLPPMVADNRDPMRTAFTVSVDYREGLTTGISAAERTATVRALATDGIQPRDFLRPGHVFPLIGRAGGVLTRSGHTEAAIDLATMAGLPAVGVLSEVVNDDGSVKRLPELVAFAREHRLKIISIEALIAARIASESVVRRLGSQAVSVAGLSATVHSFGVPSEPWQHLVAVFGDISGGEDVPCRIYREQPLKDLFEDGTRWLQAAVSIIRREGRGVIVLLRSPEAISSAEPDVREPSRDDERHGSALARRGRWREVGAGAQILRDLGIRSIALIAQQERAYVGLAGYGIQIARTIPIAQGAAERAANI